MQRRLLRLEAGMQGHVIEHVIERPSTGVKPYAVPDTARRWVKRASSA
jgi:hypothetical protein